METKKIIANKYQILRPIGQGGMAKVYLVYDLHLHKQWAMKKMLHHQSAIQEVKMLKQMDHPQIPAIIDFIKEEDNEYFIMEYIEGDTLLNYIQNTAIDSEFVYRVALELCEIMLYLHNQSPPIIYRDLKPGNLMLDYHNTIYLIDFGTARYYQKGKTKDTQLLGTRGYAAPEQFSRHHQSDVRTDIYGYGKTMLQVLHADNKQDRLHKQLASLFSHCVNEDYHQRYQNMKVIHQKLIRIRKKRRTLLVLLSIMMMLFSFTSVYFLQHYRYKQSYQKILCIRDLQKKHQQCVQLFYQYSNKLALLQLLLPIYKEDDCFSLQEQGELQLLFQQYKGRKGRAYGHFCLEVGKLYWFYEESIQSLSQKLINSTYWFKEASQYGNTADVKEASLYVSMSGFYQGIEHLKKEHRDVLIYRNLWEELKVFRQQFAKERYFETIKLTYLEFLITNYITYMRGFYQDGILEESMISAIDEVAQMNQALPIAVDSNYQQQEKIYQLCQQGYQLLAYIYS